MIIEASKFLVELDQVSAGLADWAQRKLDQGSTLDEVKQALRSAMKIVERA